MTEIEIETYSSESYSEEEEDFEYSIVIVTPDDHVTQEEEKIISNSANKQLSKVSKDHKSVSDLYQSDESFINERSSFSNFIKRQNAANKRQLKIRDNPPTERRFNPPPFKFKLKTAIPPPKTENYYNSKYESKHRPSLFERSINQKSNSKTRSFIKSNENSNMYSSNYNSHYETNDDFDFKSMNESRMKNISDSNFLNSEFKKFDTTTISKNSELIANEKDSMIINNICGSQDVINLFQLRQILRHFFIKDELLISEICAITEIKSPSELSNSLIRRQKSIYENRIDPNEDITLYNNQILKNLLTHSITEEKTKNLSNLEIKIRNCISLSFLNDKKLCQKDKI